MAPLRLARLRLALLRLAPLRFVRLKSTLSKEVWLKLALAIFAWLKPFAMRRRFRFAAKLEPCGPTGMDSSSVTDDVAAASRGCHTVR